MQSKGTPGENMPFLSSCPLYTDQNYMHYPLMEQMRLSFIDNYNTKINEFKACCMQRNMRKYYTVRKHSNKISSWDWYTGMLWFTVK
jgi:hypothetical protein